jgi:hypothetical protein
MRSGLGWRIGQKNPGLAAAAAPMVIWVLFMGLFPFPITN